MNNATLRPIPAEECFGTLPAYELRVREVQTELVEKHGIHVTRVLVTSNEHTGNHFWEDITALGWGYIDHDQDATQNHLGSYVICLFFFTCAWLRVCLTHPSVAL